jgi:hypothetical protein
VGVEARERARVNRTIVEVELVLGRVEDPGNRQRGITEADHHDGGPRNRFLLEPARDAVAALELTAPHLVLEDQEITCEGWARHRTTEGQDAQQDRRRCGGRQSAQRPSMRAGRLEPACRENGTGAPRPHAAALPDQSRRRAR